MQPTDLPLARCHESRPALPAATVVIIADPGGARLTGCTTLHHKHLLNSPEPIQRQHRNPRTHQVSADPAASQFPTSVSTGTRYPRSQNRETGGTTQLARQHSVQQGPGARSARPTRSCHRVPIRIVTAGQRSVRTTGIDAAGYWPRRPVPLQRRATDRVCARARRKGWLGLASEKACPFENLNDVRSWALHRAERRRAAEHGCPIAARYRSKHWLRKSRSAPAVTRTQMS